MPIYEYQCTSCGHQFDALQKMSDESLKDCPECMQPTLTKLVSAPSFRLSGSGWYETDFKTDKDKKKNLADAGNKTEAQSDTKKEADKPKKTETSSAPKASASA